ncbi:MAG: hypothetical protein KJ626_00270 [Verrucomicrobia bacterium]|nr:hypothetical protein [Verrucomicrobiota bacterium]
MQTNIAIRRLLACVVLACSFSCASTANAENSREVNRQLMSARMSVLVGQLDESRLLIQPGVIADRESQTVYIWGEATGLKPHDPAEFFVVSEDSGHDYEALVVAFCRASAVHRALTYIGMRPGSPVDYLLPRFWPKGERVFMNVEWSEKTNAAQRIAAEDLLVDSRTGQRLPRAGFVFVGSRWVQSDGQSDELDYAADIYSPHSIASDYNEPGTVLDVPRKAADHDVYGYQRPNPERILPRSQLVRIVLTPEFTNGSRRVADYYLEVKSGSRGHPRYQLSDDRARPVGNPRSGRSLKSILERLRREGKDVYASIRYDPTLTISAIQRAARTLLDLGQEELIRVEPPPAENLFFQAFLPDDKWRERSSRPSQPWELHIGGHRGETSAILTRIAEHWRDDQLRPELEAVDYDVANGEAVLGILQKVGMKYRVLLVFASEHITYGELMSFLRPIIPSVPTIYVFSDEEAESSK